MTATGFFAGVAVGTGVGEFSGVATGVSVGTAVDVGIAVGVSADAVGVCLMAMVCGVLGCGVGVLGPPPQPARARTARQAPTAREGRRKR